MYNKQVNQDQGLLLSCTNHMPVHEVLVRRRLHLKYALFVKGIFFWIIMIVNCHLLQGLKRPKNSCDAVGILLKELQIYSSSGKFRMLFAVKAVNGLFSEKTNIRRKGGYQVN